MSQADVGEESHHDCSDLVVRSIGPDGVAACLGCIVAARRVHPEFIGRDNGPELTDNPLRG